MVQARCKVQQEHHYLKLHDLASWVELKLGRLGDAGIDALDIAVLGSLEQYQTLQDGRIYRHRIVASGVGDVLHRSNVFQRCGV